MYNSFFLSVNYRNQDKTFLFEDTTEPFLSLTIYDKSNNQEVSMDSNFFSKFFILFTTVRICSQHESISTYEHSASRVHHSTRAQHRLETACVMQRFATKNEEFLGSLTIVRDTPARKALWHGGK